MNKVRHGKERGRSPAQRHKVSLYQKLFTHISEAILVLKIDPGGAPERVIDANDEACHIYGYTREQLLTRTYSELIWPTAQRENEPRSHPLDALPTTEKWLLRPFHVTASGRRIRVSLSGHLIEHDGNPHHLVVVRDTTDEGITQDIHHLLALLDDKILYGTTFEALLNDVAQVLRETLDVAIIDIVTMNADHVLRLQARSARNRDIEAAFIQIEEHEPPHLLSLGAMVISQSTPQKIFLRDAPASYPYKPFLTGIGCSELHGFPIMHGDKVIGAIKIAIDRDGTMTATSFTQIQYLIHRLSVLFERQVEQQQLRLRDMALSMVENAIFITDVRGTIVWANKAMTCLSGYAPEELMGHNARIFQSGVHSREFYKDLWRTIQRRKTFKGLITNRKKDDTLYTIETVITPITTQAGHITHFVSVRQDVTERVTSEAAIHHLAKTDSLTGLLNRSALRDRIHAELARIQHDHTLCALLFLDLDNFKNINDTFGHTLGDIILKAISARLTRLPAAPIA